MLTIMTAMMTVVVGYGSSRILTIMIMMVRTMAMVMLTVMVMVVTEHDDGQGE